MASRKGVALSCAHFPKMPGTIRTRSLLPDCPSSTGRPAGSASPSMRCSQLPQSRSASGKRASCTAQKISRNRARPSLTPACAAGARMSGGVTSENRAGATQPASNQASKKAIGFPPTLFGRLISSVPSDQHRAQSQRHNGQRIGRHSDRHLRTLRDWPRAKEVPRKKNPGRISRRQCRGLSNRV